ncbi:MAG: hypothetical protein JWM53_2698 [bacterium]|nr:hypothetical protein [bacterium]
MSCGNSSQGGRSVAENQGRESLAGKAGYLVALFFEGSSAGSR